MNRFSVAVPWCILVLVGCDSRSPSTGTESGPLPLAVATEAPKIPIRLASWAEVEQLVARNSGKVVVLDVWSTSCVPCIKEFPNLVKLHQQHAGRVACLSLNCDYTGLPDAPPESVRTEVEAFLTKQGATFDNLICTDTDEKLFESLNVASIPVVRVYDKQGKLRQQFDNDENEYGDEGFGYDKHIVPLVNQLVAE